MIIKSANENKKYVWELLLSDKPILLEVRVECCNSTFIEAIIQKIENEFNNKIKIARMEYQTYKNLLPGTDVKNFPTVLLIKDKNVIKVFDGPISRSNLKAIATEALKSN